MPEFHLLLSGPDQQPVARLDLDCEDEQEAMRIAASVISPHGHELLEGNRFLGRFDPTWGEHLEEEDEDSEDSPLDDQNR
jgi:hypothetical protein